MTELTTTMDNTLTAGTPQVYVCSVSDYNQPELESCLYHRPQQLILIVSHRMRNNGSASRLLALLSQRLPGTQIRQLDDQSSNLPFNSDELCENLAWLNHNLVPRLQELEQQGYQCCLNFTGGTKALSMALLLCYPWYRCEYKPHNKNKLQQYQLDLTSDSQPVSLVSNIRLADADPLDIARLHNAGCKTKEPNSLEQHSESASLAQKIWDDLSQPEGVLVKLFSLLEEKWTQADSSTSSKNITLAWQEIHARAPAHAAQLEKWCQQLASLNPNVVTLDQEGITLPGPDAKGAAKAWRRWVCGDWLEQLIATKIRAQGIPNSAIARNLVVTDQSIAGHDGREADLLINWQGKTLLIEAKADIPRTTSFSELEKQISSLGDRFGHTRKVLFIGPQLKKHLDQDKRTRLEERCKASRITLHDSFDALLSEWFPDTGF